MSALLGGRVAFVLTIVLAVIAPWTWGRSAVTSASPPGAADLRIDTSHPGVYFAAGTVGLSTEARELDTDHLSPAHHRLVNLMRMLGPAVLRIGGSTVDFSWWTSNHERRPSWATSTITPTALSVLHDLLIATKWKVLLGVDLGHFEPARAAAEAHYAKKILGDSLLGIEIGNEPNGYSGSTESAGGPILRSPQYEVSEYSREVAIYRHAVVTAAPGTAVFGPDAGGTAWLAQMGVGAHVFTELTQHFYPIKACIAQEQRLRPTAAELLSPAVRQQEDAVLSTLAVARRVTRRAARLAETNSIGCSVNAYASPAYAGAIWALDWALRSASSGVVGANFHGRFGVCRAYRESPVCAAGGEAAANAGKVSARPEYYGLLAASQLEGGRFVPTQLRTSLQLPNLTTWATLTSGGTVKIAIDNMATTGAPQPVSIPMSGYVATEELLNARSSSGVQGIITLGSATVTSNGNWHPKRRLLEPRRVLHVVLPSASAMIITLHRKSTASRVGVAKRRARRRAISSVAS